MMTEERLRSKRLYKIELYTAKIIPMIIAAINLANIVLSYFYIDLDIFSYLGGVSFLVLVRFYITSYAYKFCSYHRMFLHYILVANLINIYDTYIGIPISNRSFLVLQVAFAIVCLFIILYLKFKVCSPLKE